MVSSFFGNAKDIFKKKRSSSSEATSNHPLQNDKPRGDPGSRHHGSPKKEETTAQVDAPLPSGGVALREENDTHIINSQPACKPMQVFPPKETPTTPPESIHVPNHPSMHEFRARTQEKQASQGQQLITRESFDRALDISEARMKEVGRLNKEVQRLNSIVNSTVSAEKIAGNKISDLERKVRLQEEDIQNLKRKLRISEEQRTQTTKLLDDRTAELKGAQAFLTTADRYSGADIIKMAESLNAEIFQASALMAELLVDAPSLKDSIRQGQYIQKYKHYLDHGRQIIGSQLFDHLETKSREIRFDPLPLQLAFQALFTWWCNYEVDQFCEGPTGKSLRKIYRRIFESETQAVAGRWRAMTSMQTMDPDASSHAESVVSVILALMVICGWFGSQDASQRALQSVREAVLRVEKMWKTFKVATMQEITAAEIKMVCITPGLDYDAGKMDDMYMHTTSDATTNPDNCRQPILCCVGVGLLRDVSKRSEDGTMHIHQEVIFKPKIALASALLNRETFPNTQENIVLSTKDSDGKD